MNIIDELKMDHYSEVIKIKNEHVGLFNSMMQPSAFTINIHKTVRVLNSERRNVKKKVELIDINSLWSTLSFEFLKMNYLSSQRNKFCNRVIAFGNVDVGDGEGMAHIHGVIENVHNLPTAPFHYLIRTALNTTNAKHRIISGKPDIQSNASIGWVDYVFKNKYLHPLMTKA
jgi:hypothetical protein